MVPAAVERGCRVIFQRDSVEDILKERTNAHNFVYVIWTHSVQKMEEKVLMHETAVERNFQGGKPLLLIVHERLVI